MNFLKLAFLKNGTVLSFIFCIFILLYVFSYYEYKKHTAELNQQDIVNKQLAGLNNINNLNCDKLKYISNITYNGSTYATLNILNEYNVNIELQCFYHIDNQNKLHNLDSFIAENTESVSKEKIIYEYEMVRIITNYLTKIN